MHNFEGVRSEMSPENLPGAFSVSRRHFFSTAALTAAAAQFGIVDPITANTSIAAPNGLTSTHSVSSKTKSSAALPQINPGLLNSGSAEPGPGNAPAVILL